jgi:hypothetical protein
MRTWTRPEEATQIIAIYESGRKLKDVTGADLVRNIEWRIYTEWCCNDRESDWNDHIYYRGHAFYDWLTAETHYALERAGYAWDEKQKRFFPEENFDWVYDNTRTRVLGAIVRRSVHFFSHCKDFRWVPEGNTENLRASLDSYL